MICDRGGLHHETHHEILISPTCLDCFTVWKVKRAVMKELSFEGLRVLLEDHEHLVQESSS